MPRLRWVASRRLVSRSQRLAASHRQSGQVTLTRSSVDLALALAEGDLDRAAAIDRIASRIADEFQGGQNSYGYWYRVARIQFLVRSGQPDVAARQADDALVKLEKSHDRALVDRIRSAAAFAFATLGNSRRSVDLLSEVAVGPLSKIPELVATAEAALGNIDGLSDAQAYEHLERAGRIFGHLGHQTGRAAALTDYERRAQRHIATKDAGQRHAADRAERRRGGVVRRVHN